MCSISAFHPGGLKGQSFKRHCTSSGALERSWVDYLKQTRSDGSGAILTDSLFK
jgi:hypothetical protein